MYRGVGSGAQDAPPVEPIASAVERQAEEPRRPKVAAPTAEPRPRSDGRAGEALFEPQPFAWPGWLPALGNFVFSLLIGALFIWVAVKILFADVTFTLAGFDLVGLVPETWAQSGVEILSIGIVTVWYLLGLGISIMQFWWFPFHIRPRENGEESPWYLRIRFRTDLEPWKIATWFVVSFINVGTSYAGLGAYIRGEGTVAGVTVLPLFDGIMLPQTGWAYVTITLLGAAFTSQAPEPVFRRALRLIFEAFGVRRR